MQFNKGIYLNWNTPLHSKLSDTINKWTTHLSDASASSREFCRENSPTQAWVAKVWIAFMWRRGLPEQIQIFHTVTGST